MARIVPGVLRRLRMEKGWSLDQLADRTKPRINKQTIHRIEKGKLGSTRDSTLRQLARALDVDPTVLIGASPPPDKSEDEPKLSQMAKLGFEISASAHNALFLVSERFFISQAEIVELAPFLFCWAAEASLQRRRELLRQAETACEYARTAESAMNHLDSPDLGPSEQRIAAERESIEQEDLFGLSLDFHSKPGWTDNPFSLFLETLTKDMSDGTAFDGYHWREFPEYRVCTEGAARYAGDDPVLLERILDGHVMLKNIPSDLNDKWDERAKWLRAQAQAYRDDIIRRLESRRLAEQHQ